MDSSLKIYSARDGIDCTNRLTMTTMTKRSQCFVQCNQTSTMSVRKWTEKEIDRFGIKTEPVSDCATDKVRKRIIYMALRQDCHKSRNEKPVKREGDDRSFSPLYDNADLCKFLRVQLKRRVSASLLWVPIKWVCELQRSVNINTGPLLYLLCRLIGKNSHGEPLYKK